MTEPLSEEQLKGFASIPDILRPTRPYAATCIQRLLDEVERLRAERAEAIDALQSAKWVLKRAGCLRSIGYNERHTEDIPDQTDETGTTIAEHRASAKKMEANIAAARGKVEAALRWEYRSAKEAL